MEYVYVFTFQMLENYIIFIKLKNMTITLLIKTKHFGEGYSNPNICPLAKAAKEQFETDNASEREEYILINSKSYEHHTYQYEDYAIDRQKLEENQDPETIIREIELNPINDEKIILDPVDISSL